MSVFNRRERQSEKSLFQVGRTPTSSPQDQQFGGSAADIDDQAYPVPGPVVSHCDEQLASSELILYRIHADFPSTKVLCRRFVADQLVFIIPLPTCVHNIFRYEYGDLTLTCITIPNQTSVLPSLYMKDRPRSVFMDTITSSAHAKKFIDVFAFHYNCTLLCNDPILKRDRRCDPQKSLYLLWLQC